MSTEEGDLGEVVTTVNTFWVPLGDTVIIRLNTLYTWIS